METFKNNLKGVLYPFLSKKSNVFETDFKIFFKYQVFIKYFSDILNEKRKNV